MHSLLFSIKRLHLRGLRVGRRLLARTAMTPARFDLVCVMAELAPCWGKVARRQSDLWKGLGVARTTVCRMLRRMEELGLVQRTVDPKDRRQRWVELTRAGAAMFRLARRLVNRPLARIVEYLIPDCGFRWNPPEGTSLIPNFEPLAPVADALRRARWRIRDPATFEHLLLPRVPLRP